MKKLFLILTAAALSFVGCKSVSSSAEGSSTSAVSIEGEWQTSKLEIGGVEQELCPSEMSIAKKDGDLYSINGDSGVNRFFGDVKVSGSSFKVQDNIGSTRMAGDPVSMTISQTRFFRLYHGKHSRKTLQLSSKFQTKTENAQSLSQRNKTHSTFASF